MFKAQKLLGRCLLVASLVWLLAACGTGSIASSVGTSANSLETIQSLEQYLNQGKVPQALNLFSEKAVVLEVHSGENGNDQTSGYYTLGGYYIPRAYSAGASESLYKGP